MSSVYVYEVILRYKASTYYKCTGATMTWGLGDINGELTFGPPASRRAAARYNPPPLYV